MTEVVEEKKVSTRSKSTKQAEPTSALWIATRFSEHSVVILGPASAQGRRQTTSLQFKGHKLELDLTDANQKDNHAALQDAVKKKGIADIVLVREVVTPNTSAQKAEMAKHLQNLRVEALRPFLTAKERTENNIELRADPDGKKFEAAQLIAVICDTKTFNMENE